MNLIFAVLILRVIEHKEVEDNHVHKCVLVLFTRPNAEMDESQYSTNVLV